MKKLAMIVSTILLSTSAITTFASIKLSSHPNNLAATGDFQGKVLRTAYSQNSDGVQWVRVVVGATKGNNQYVIEFNDKDLPLGQALLTATNKKIDVLYSNTNGEYIVNFFELKQS